MTPSPYGFRPFTRADLAMAARWRGTPEVTAWWGDPAEQIALLEEDLDRPQMRQWIVTHRGRSFAHVLPYPTPAWPQSHLAYLPRGAEVVDAFIGEPDMAGRHGGASLRAFADMPLTGGAAAVAIDPDTGNIGPRRAYARAGFVGEKVVETPEEGPEVAMVFAG